MPTTAEPAAPLSPSGGEPGVTSQAVIGKGLAAPMPGRSGTQARTLRALSAVALLLLLALWPGARGAAAASLADAYVAVTVFVAATLMVLFWLERRAGVPLADVLRRHQRFEVPISAGLGALPGCGGAIAVIAQYTRGHVSFGGVVAALTATMGDAMFVLLAADPRAALLVMATGLLVGLVSGAVVNAIHGRDFLRPPAAAAAPCERLPDHPMRPADWLWLALLGPGLVLGAANAVQADLGWSHAYGVIAGAFALALWVWRGGGGEVGSGRGLPAVINDTGFVTAWVFAAFLAFELVVLGTGLDLGTAFAQAAPLVPLMAIIVGFIPGCGPQIIVTGLYAAGAIPLSAQLGNAISNDGDALFPALALIPRAALVATLYSAVPALLVAYGWWAVFERTA